MFLEQQAVTNMYKVKPISASYVSLFDKARLHISVGSGQTVEKYIALCDWLGNRFDATNFIVSDTLQKYNIAFEEKISLEEAEEKALRDGDQWLEENAKAIVLTKNVSITRWDDMIQKPEYMNNLDLVYKAYQDNEKFRNLCRQAITEFWVRRSNKNPEVYLSSRYFEYCEFGKKYMLEELAAIPLLFKDKALDIYPGSWLSTIFELFQADASIGLQQQTENAKWMSVDFVRRK